jgi:hypothetical protein
MKWKIEYYVVGEWQLIAAGRNRPRLALLVLLCSFARPTIPHRVLWGGRR